MVHHSRLNTKSSPPPTHRLVCLNTWFPGHSTVLWDYEIFGTWRLGSRWGLKTMRVATWPCFQFYYLFPKWLKGAGELPPWNLPCLAHHDGKRDPGTVCQNKVFLAWVAYAGHFIIATRTVSNVLLNFPQGNANPSYDFPFKASFSLLMLHMKNLVVYSNSNINANVHMSAYIILCVYCLCDFYFLKIGLTYYLNYRF